MNKLSMDKKAAVISGLVEGCSVRSVSRMTGIAKGTILRLLAAESQHADEYAPLHPFDQRVLQED